jgi:hypothetical protein
MSAQPWGQFADWHCPVALQVPPSKHATHWEPLTPQAPGLVPPTHAPFAQHPGQVAGLQGPASPPPSRHLPLTQLWPGTQTAQVSPPLPHALD